MKKIGLNFYNLKFYKFKAHCLDNNKTIAKPSAVPAPIFGPQPASLMRSAPLINTVKAIPGKCDPKPVCITNPLIVNLTPSESVFPPCINIHRCDGCCPINENCVAIQSDELKLSDVVVINMDKGKYQDNIITVQNHTSCECQCIWKTDEDCQKENPNFIKNPDACECICPEEMICSNFHEFDQETCSCKCKKNKFSKLEQICKTRGFDWNEEFCRFIRKLYFKTSIQF